MHMSTPARRGPVARRRAALAAAALVASAATAQTPPAPTPAATPAPAPSPARASASAPASAPASPGSAQRVEITGGRTSDVDQRRQSTAAKIVIGREDIEKFGDATLGEVLRRLPGVSTPGAPGRGGPPRMRGLGGGFTQILIDGQRVPPGFSLDSLTPEQIDRIEILRAPTAETGARAIAGTINIITRDGFRRRLNELRIGTGIENGKVGGGVFWSHNDGTEALTYNLNAGLFRRNNRTETTGSTVDENLTTGRIEKDERSSSIQDDRRTGLNFNARLQWRLSEAGDALVLMPNVFVSDGGSERSGTTTGNPLFDRTFNDNENRFWNARLMTQWRQRVGASRLELNANLGAFGSRGSGLRRDFLGAAANPVAEDRTRTREDSLNLTAKTTTILGGAQAPAAPGAGRPAGPPVSAEHTLVVGGELELVQREETRSSLIGGVPQLADFGENLEARTLRAAAYAQDEWNLNPKWAVHAGLRWEGIRTQGSAQGGARPENESSVWTPLVHLLWKPNPARREQVRISLTRSYRSPETAQLIARPSVNSRYPTSGPNIPTAPDSAGNPGLKPELASGLDLAWERYFDGGGLVSANLFARRITNLMRNVVALETVSWSPVQRYVSRRQNIGDASTYGLELEARYRLDQLVDGAPRVEMRHNLSFYRSSVEGIPGPDNRLDQQAPWLANIGADYRFRGTPLTLGGTLGLTGGFNSQLAADRSTRVNSKRVLDVYGLWTFSPAVGLRLLASNLGPRDYETESVFTTATLRETSRSLQPGDVNWQLRLELKL
jgi:iron complex outermembrane receptor protein